VIDKHDIPLTNSQLQLWKSQAISPDKPLLNQVITIDIDLNFYDKQILQGWLDAWHRVVELNPILRYTVHTGENDLPVQRVSDISPQLHITDLNGEASLQSWLERRKTRIFKLDESLIDSSIIRLSSKKSVLYLNVHHLIVDAWSMMLIWRALLSEYTSSGSCDAAQLHFSEYANECNNVTYKVSDNRKFDFQDSSIARRPEFYDYNERSITSESVRVNLPLTETIWARLANLNNDKRFQQINNNLFFLALHLTALTIYCHRTTGDENIGIEMPLLGRLDSKWMNTVGNFIEMTHIEITISPADSVSDLYQQCRDKIFSMFKSASRAISKTYSGQSVHAVLNFVTAHQPDTASPLANAGFSTCVRWHHSGHSDTHHPLRLHITDWNNLGEADVDLDINTGFFPAAQHHRVVQHCTAVYATLSANPDAPIGQLALSQEQELWRFQGHQDNLTSSKSLFKQINHIASENADAIAISDGTTQITYANLISQSKIIFHQLRDMNITKGSRVAVFLPRSLSIPAVLLGILRCGSCYVPIDIKQPLKRVHNILDNAEVACVISDKKHLAQIPGNFRGITIESLLQAAPNFHSGDDFSEPESDSTAYIIYTSGSTGTPKGVAISHAAMWSYLAWANKYYRLNSPIVMPFFTSISFDLTLTSLFLPLLAGGTIRVYNQDSTEDSLVLLDVLRDNFVNTVKLTPTHLQLLQGQDLTVSTIAQLIVGGEDFKSSVAEQTVQRFARPIRIVNEYGPTEGTVGCIVKDWQSGESSQGSVPIGLPIDNSSAYVLTEFHSPQLEGVAGELFIAGPGLAKGYWRDPELTKAQFIDNPWIPGEKMYHTGDLAKVVNGEIAYLGRNDSQVKLNGIRVDLTEIEAALLEHPDVSLCVALANEETDFKNRTDTERHCVTCGLSSLHPEAHLNSDDICEVCLNYEPNKPIIDAYFKSSQELSALVNMIKSNSSNEFDAVVLLSGGKDSTYTLCKLVDLGLRVYALSLDNGFLSDGAKQNISTVCDTLNVKHHYATTAAMQQIFADSLERYSNVCNGCFKTIYSLALKFAEEHDIKYIFTGLSRGQLFETRLNNELFAAPDISETNIDDMVKAARVQYHAHKDAANTLLNIEAVNNGDLVGKIEIVDFYRYCHVELNAMLAYIKARAGWVRPPDTGRSTNCLINDVGIHVHKLEQGYHNYSLPYSWDVRLGHKNRADALDELDDDINPENVQSILRQLGYTPKPEREARTSVTLHYTAKSDLSHAQLNTWLSERLPPYMFPKNINQVAEMPMSKSGKVDRQKLQTYNTLCNAKSRNGEAPASPEEIIVANAWKSHIQAQEICVNDNFFELGGDSLSAIRCVMQLRKMGHNVEPADLFQKPVLGSFATLIKHATPKNSFSADGKKAEKFASLGSEQKQKLAALLQRKSVD